MKSDTLLASAAILFHIVALSLAALPDPAERQDIDAPVRLEDDALSAALTRPLGRVAGLASALQSGVLAATRPVRVLTEPYVNAGFPQRWIMFSHPWTFDQYLRIDHHVATPGAARPHLVVRELVLPTQDEERVRLVHAFRDKATVSAFEAHMHGVLPTASEADEVAGRSSIEALVRHRRSILEAGGRVGPGDEVRRTEVWLGRAPIPPPGRRLDPQALGVRLDLLRRYRDGALDGPPPAPSVLEELDDEADISWMLIHIEQP